MAAKWPERWQNARRSRDSRGLSKQSGNVGRRFRARLRWPEVELCRGCFIGQESRRKGGGPMSYSEGERVIEGEERESRKERENLKFYVLSPCLGF